MINDSKTYIGIVVDNKDPRKLCRCRIRVIDVFDDIPVDDIPWASPWKDINGNSSNIPEIGKVLTVVFDMGNIYKPEYIYSEHFNINLETKLSKLDGDDYLSMKSTIFDNKTQVFVNNKDGLVMDYKYHQVNIKDTGIDVNLKDNNGVLNLGSGSANQQAILGTNFLQWFDEFVDNLMGEMGGPYFGNQGAPVIPNPALVAVLQKYQALKDPKFLSRNVNINDNGYIDSSIIPTQDTRINIDQVGDKWKSTIKELEIETEVLNARARPEQADGGGTGEDFNPKYSGPIDGNLTTPSGSDNAESFDVSEGSTPPLSDEVNPDVDALLQVLKNNNYAIFEKPFEMNIIGVRYQYQNQEYSNKFIDRLYVVYKNDSNAWKSHYWPMSTVPGKFGGGEYKRTLHKDIPKIKDRGGMGILKPAQYLDSWSIGTHIGEKALIPGKQKFYRDSNYGDPKITYSKSGEKYAGMLIHKAFKRSQGKNTYGVYNWSEGCQVIPDPAHLDQFFNLLEKHRDKYGNKFTYTLITSKDVEDAEKSLV